MLRIIRKKRSRLHQQQPHSQCCGSMTLQTITSLLALRGLYAILTSDDLSYFDYSQSLTVKNLLQEEDSATSNSIRRGNKNDLFHSIHVYRGPDTAIQNLDAKSSEMKQNYNPKSQIDQDKIISALTTQLQTKETASNQRLYFVDLAANDAIQLSNTLQLEEEGWHGLCIEPNPIYWYRLAHRKCDVAAAFVGGKRDMQQVDVSLRNEEYGGIVGDQMDNTDQSKLEVDKRYTISLQSLFQEFKVPYSIDYMSLDVEGAEELVMEDFPFQTYTIRFLTVERPKLGLQKVLKANGYHFVMMLVFWGETLWVHESVLQLLTLQEIQQTVEATSNHVQRAPKIPQAIFNIETGEYGGN